MNRTGPIVGQVASQLRQIALPETLTIKGTILRGRFGLKIGKALRLLPSGKGLVSILGLQ